MDAPELRELLADASRIAVAAIKLHESCGPELKDETRGIVIEAVTCVIVIAGMCHLEPDFGVTITSHAQPIKAPKRKRKAKPRNPRLGSQAWLLD